MALQTYTCYRMGDSRDTTKFAWTDVTYDDATLDVRRVQVFNDTSGVATFRAYRRTDGAEFVLTAQPNTRPPRQNVTPGIFTLQLLDGVDPWPGPDVELSMALAVVG